MYCRIRSSSLAMCPLWFLDAPRSSSCTISGMENARNDIEALDDLELDAPASVPAASDDVAAPPRPAKRPRREAPTDEERRQMHASFNDRISYLCKMAALVVALVSLATIALGQELPQFVLMGLCLSVALLAIAMLQDHHQRKR